MSSPVKEGEGTAPNSNTPGKYRYWFKYIHMSSFQSLLVASPPPPNKKQEQSTQQKEQNLMIEVMLLPDITFALTIPYIFPMQRWGNEVEIKQLC